VLRGKGRLPELRPERSGNKQPRGVKVDPKKTRTREWGGGGHAGRRAAHDQVYLKKKDQLNCGVVGGRVKTANLFKKTPTFGERERGVLSYEAKKIISTDAGKVK